MRDFFMDEEMIGCPADLQHISYDEDTTARQLVDNLGGSLAVIETTSTASQPYTAGKRLVYKGKLYKTTQSIAQGGTLLPGTNITPDTIDSELNTISTNLFANNSGTVINLSETLTTLIADGYIWMRGAGDGTSKGQVAVYTADNNQIATLTSSYTSSGWTQSSLFVKKGMKAKVIDSSHIDFAKFTPLT